jgi:hypothetical protein
VRILWDAWENGTPDVGEKEIFALMEVECQPKSQRLSGLFARPKKHPAWDTMIRRGATRGTRRLSPPDQPKT